MSNPQQPPLHRRKRRGMREWFTDLSRNTQVMVFVLSLAAILFFATQFPALALVFIVLAANTAASILKKYLAAVPIDVDVLAVGTAYASAQYGFGAALLLVLVGPPLSEYVQGGIRELVWIKMVSLLVTAIAALVLGTQSLSLFIAVIIGLGVQYILMAITTNDTTLNAVRRISNALLAGYILFFFIPLVT
jgi:hypothetical protein